MMVQFIMAEVNERDGRSIFRLRKHLWKYEMPRMLLYGASHLTRLETWMGLQRDPEDASRPTALDGRALSRARYCAVGGSKFSTIHDRVQGINVPLHQPPKGNQWQKLLDDKYMPSYTVVCLGGNYTSAFRDKL